MRWSYEVVKHFKNENYNNIIEYDDLQERKIFRIKIGEGVNGKPLYDQVQGWLVQVEKDKIILPEEVGGKDLRDLLPVKILRTEPFPYQTTVYHKPISKGGLVSFKIPPQKVFSFRQWVDEFYNIEHSEPKQFLLYKLLILGSYLVRFNWRVTTGAGFGKNGVIEVFSTLLRDSAVFCPKSDPKLMKMLDKRRILVIDEWMDLELSRKEKLEYVFRGASDGRPDMINNALSNEKYKTKDNYDLSELSMGFIYNELDYYQPPNIKKDKKAEYFDNLYTLATKERFIPFHFSGRIDATQFVVENDKQTYEDSKAYLKDWVKTTIYFTQNFHSELIGKEKWEWKDSQILGGNKYNRLNNMFSSFRLVLKAYAKNEEEYNELCDLALDRYFAYEHMLGNTHIQRKVEEISIED